MRSPARVVRVVVLPAPLRPTRPIRSPGCTRRFASLMRMRLPARSSRPVVVITEPRVGGIRRKVRIARGDIGGIDRPTVRTLRGRGRRRPWHGRGLLPAPTARGAPVASADGGIVVRLLLLVVAGAAAWFSVRAAHSGLRSSEEVLAACAAGLAIAGASQGGPALDGDPVTALLLAIAFLILALVAPTTAAWPLVSWAAAQLAVLRGLDLVPAALHTELYLCVALLGLGIALVGRRVVARVALLTTAPWWLAGVVGGSSSAWADDHGRQWFSAALMIAAGFGLLLARLREPL